MSATTDFREHGFSIVRGVVSADDLRVIDGVIDDAFSSYLESLPPDSANRKGYETNRWVCVGDMQRRIGIPRKFMSLSRRLANVAAEVTGYRRPYFHADHSYVKRIRPEEYDIAKITWHRDAEAAGTIYHGDCANVWVPLNDVGNGSPSLQLVPGSHKTMREIPTNFDKGYPCEVIDESKITSIATPRLNRGDVVVFDHHTLHRTELVNSPLARNSFECRIGFSPSATAMISRHLRNLRSAIKGLALVQSR